MGAMRGLVAMLGCFAAGCLGPSAHPCESPDHSQSWLCPANLACAQAPTYCGAPGLIEQCNGKPDFETCAYSDTEAGACFGGVCEACTPDREGCPSAGWVAMTSNTAANLRAIWVAGRGNAFAGGDDGALLHYDGTAWTPQDFPALPQGHGITGLWGTNDQDVFAAAASQIFHWNGNTWTAVATGPRTLTTISGAGGVIVAVGQNASIVQFDGAQWTATENVLNLAPAPLYGVWATDADNIFAVGSAGLILRFHGGAWAISQAPSAGAAILEAAWGPSANDVYAIGDSVGLGATIAHFNGTSWASEPLMRQVSFYGIWGASSTNVFACGQAGQLAQRTDTWSVLPKTMTPPTTPDLRAIAGSSATDIFAVGLGGAIWHYTGN
jgi:hypothetical protein